MAHVRRKRRLAPQKREPGYATNSAGGRGASAAGPEIPKEAGPSRRAQRRGAGDAGGIPTRSMHPHRRTDARPYAERGIAGGAGMRRCAANAPRATAGNAGIQGGRRADGGAAAKNSPPKAISRLPSAARARRMRRKPRASTPPGISRRFAGTGRAEREMGNKSHMSHTWLSDVLPTTLQTDEAVPHQRTLMNRMNSSGVRNACRIMNRMSTCALDHLSTRLQWSWSGNRTPCNIRTRMFWRS